MLIPKQFHFIWIGSDLPRDKADNIDTWQDGHPDWDVKLWNDSNIPDLINSKYFDESRYPAQKADIARYEILYRYGGVYIDTDFQCLKNISNLIAEYDSFISTEDDAILNIAIMGAVSNHQWIARLIELVPKRMAEFAGAPPDVQTGPRLATQDYINALRKNLPAPEVFPRKLFYPYHYWEKPRS